MAREQSRMVPVGSAVVRVPVRSKRDRPDLPYALELVADLEDGRAVCTELVVRRRKGGPPVTAEGLRRLPVARLVREEIAHSPLGGTLRPNPKGGHVVEPFSDAAAEELDRTLAGRPKRKREDRAVRLQRVADTYRMALAAVEPPSLAVRDREGVSAEHARRLVSQARDAGFLGAAVGGGRPARPGPSERGGTDMAHVTRHCANRSCRRSVPDGARTCPACGSQEVVYWARWLDPDRKEHAKQFRRKVDAQAHAENVEGSKRTGDYIDPKVGRRPVSEVLEDWFAAAAPSLKPKTRASYRGLIDVRVTPYIGSRQVGSLKPSDVQRWVNDLTAAGLSASRIRQAHILLGQALDAAVGDNLMARNPARHSGVKLPKLVRREAAYLEPKQVAAIAAAAPPPYDLLVKVLGQTGIRWGEAVALRRRSVDLLGRSLLIRESLAEVSGELSFGPTKSHAERRVPLTASLAAALEAHLEEQVGADLGAIVFTSPRGRPVRYTNFRRTVWTPALKAAKLPPMGLHVLRHSAAAMMIHAGASPKMLQTVLGHGSAAFTLTVYGHVFDADLGGLAERLEAVASPPETEPGRSQDGAAVSAGTLHSL